MGTDVGADRVAGAAASVALVGADVGDDVGTCAGASLVFSGTDVGADVGASDRVSWVSWARTTVLTFALS